MRRFLAVAAVAAVALAGCTPAQAASSEIKARWGETVEVDDIAVTLNGNPDNACYKLTIGNERWLRDISADEGGVVAGYAGVQDGDVHLYLKDSGPDDGQLNWGSLAPVEAGESKTAEVCKQYYATSSRVEVDVADTTVIFR